MKTTSLALVFFSCVLVCGGQVDASRTGSVSRGKSGEKKAKLPQGVQGVQTRAFVGQQDDTTGAGTKVSFKPTAYDPSTDTLYLGASSAKAGDAALVSAQNDPETKKVTFTKLASDKNLSDKVVQKIALVGTNGSLPLVTANDVKDVILVTNLEDGSSVVTSGGTIADAAKAVIKSAPVAVAGTRDENPYVFAAVRHVGVDKARANSGALVPGQSAKVAEQAVLTSLESKLNDALGLNKPTAGLAETILKNDSGFLNAVETLVNAEAVKQFNATNTFIATDKEAVAAEVFNVSDKNTGTVPVAAAQALSVDKTALAAALSTDKTFPASATVASVLDKVAADGSFKDALTITDLTKAVLAGGAAPDTLLGGAGAALESGIAWAVRSAAISDNANAIKPFYAAGATEAKAQLEAASKLQAKYAADKIKGDDVGEKVAAALVFKDATATQIVNQRLIQAGDAAFKLAKDEAGPIATVLVNKVIGNVLKMSDAGRAAIALDATALGNVSKEADDAGAATAAIAGTNDVVVDAAGAGLEDAIGRAAGLFQFKGIDAGGGVVGKNSDVAAVGAIMSTALAGLSTQALTDKKGVIKLTTDSLKADIDTDTNKLKTNLFDLINPVVTDVTNGRLPLAAVHADGLARVDAGTANSILARAVAKIGGSDQNNIKAALPADVIKNGSAVGVDTVDAVSALVKSLVTDKDNKDEAVAAAIAAAFAWGVHNTIVSDTTPANIKTNLVTPVLDKLAQDIILGGAAVTAINAIKTDSINEVRDALVRDILLSVQVGAAGTAGKIKEAFDADDKGVKAAVQASINDPFKTVTNKSITDIIGAQDKIASIVTLASAKGVDDAVGEAKTVSTNEAVIDGFAVATEAALGWGARTTTMNTKDADLKATFVTSPLFGGSAIWDDGKLFGAMPAGGVQKAALLVLRDNLTTDNLKVNTGDSLDVFTQSIKNSVKSGTANTITYLQDIAANDPLKDTGDIISKTVELLLTKPDDVIAGNVDRIKNAAKAASVGAAADAVSAAAGADKLASGGVAGVEGALGWLIANTEVKKDPSLQWGSDNPDGTNRGFAILKKEGDVLKLKDATDLTLDGKSAVPFDLTALDDQGANAAKINVAFADTSTDAMKAAFLGSNDVDMHWDGNLQRLYISLPNVGRADAPPAAVTNLQGGVSSILVAGIKDDEVFLKPVIAYEKAVATKFAKDFFTKNGTDGIVGFYAEKDQPKPAASVLDIRASTLRSRTMHTSTGKDYLIVNGGVNDVPGNVASWVYALPVMPAFDAKGVASETAGQLAVTDGANPFKLPDADANKIVKVDQTHKFPGTGGTPFDAKSEIPYVVGGDPRFIGGADTNNPILDMQIVGDTVYVGVAGDRTAGFEAGIFASTAIFDADGLIQSWTPWQRVETIDAVSGFGFDEKTARVKYLTGAATDTVKATQWGQSDNVVSAGGGSNLSKIIADKFPNGVFKIVNFDEKTPGFAPGEFSMMAAVGGDTVALIQTGQKNGAVAGSLSPITKFFDSGAQQNVVVYNSTTSPDLGKIAPLLTVDLFKDATNDDTGYLFVGGLKGMARLEDPASGAGFKNQTVPLTKLTPTVGANNFPQTPTQFNFKQVNPAVFNKPVVGLATDKNNKEMVVLSFGNLAKTEALNPAKTADTLVLDGKAVALKAASMLAVDDGVGATLVILATPDGLQTTKDFGATLTDPKKGITGQPVQMAYVSATKGMPSPQGNLYVFTVDRLNNDSKIYRLAVDATKPDIDAQLSDPVEVADLQELRDGFATDGSVILDYQSLSLDNADAVRVVDSQGNPQSITSLLGLNPTDNIVRAPVKNTAQGSWIDPIQKSVVVNE